MEPRLRGGHPRQRHGVPLRQGDQLLRPQPEGRRRHPPSFWTRKRLTRQVNVHEKGGQFGPWENPEAWGALDQGSGQVQGTRPPGADRVSCGPRPT
ncbi:hypothetical protein GTY41_19625 [Streptomyces sp. SID685]|nr:hypothetical protein [Streptomyces sp. SID685]